MNDLAVYMLIAIEVLVVGEKVKFVVIWRIEVFHLDCGVSLCPFDLFFFIQKGCFCFCRESFGDLHQLPFDFQDWSFFDEDAIIEVLHIDLRQDVEVFFIEVKRHLNQVKNIVNMIELEFVIGDDSDNV